MASPDISEPRTDWPLILAIWLAGLGAAAQYGKISVIFDRLQEVYPEAGPALGFAVSLVGGVGIVLGVAAGVLVARIGYRQALLGGLALGALASALQAFWPPLPLFLGLRLIEGVAHLAIVVAAPSLIAERSTERHRGFALTLWGSFFGVAFAVLAWAGIALVERFGLAALIWAHAGYMAAMLALLWPRLPRTDAQPQAIDLRVLLAAHSRIYTSPRIGAPALGWLCYTACFVSFLTLIPPFIAPEARAWVMPATPLISIVASLTLGVFLLRFVSAAQVVMIGFVAAAGIAVALAGAPGNPALILALGAAMGLVQGASFAAVAQLNHRPEARALANGGLAQMGNLGNTSGTPALLLVLGAAGSTGFLISLAALLLAGALVHLFCATRR